MNNPDFKELRAIQTNRTIKQGRKPYLNRKVVEGLKMLYEAANTNLNTDLPADDFQTMAEAGRWIAGMLRYYDQKDKRKHEAQKPRQKDQGK